MLRKFKKDIQKAIETYQRPAGKYFISHSYRDAEVRERLLKQLPAGMIPFIFPPITVNPQDFVSNHLIEAILSCDGLIYLKGGSSAQSFWVAFERDFAIRNGMPVFAADPTTLVIERDLSDPLDLAVYASYYRKDVEKVINISSFLEEKRSFDFWLDYRDLKINSTGWQSEVANSIADRIDRGGYLLVFWSKLGANSGVIKREIMQALEHANKGAPRVLFALLDSHPLPEYLQNYQEAPVQLFGDTERPESHRLDDLIVRLYWLIYRNRYENQL